MKNKTATFVRIVILLCLIVGCSSVPYPIHHEFTVQKKMQAAQHWNILAEDVAEQIRISLINHNELSGKSCYVMNSEQTPFGQLFDKLLISQLIKKGIAVSSIDANSINIEYSARVLTHSERQIDKMPLKYTALAIGVNVARNAYTWNIPNLLRLTVGLGAIADLSELIGVPNGVSKNEVILFTRITYGSRIYFQQADIYYINDPEWWHYTKEPRNNSENIDGRKYELKNE